MAVNSESYTGKYDKKKLLGKGTFGEAWLVMSRASGKSYVMKEMCTGGWDEKEKELSMNEVNILASCNHVNIVRYAGAYIVKKNLSSERILIIMEFCDAGDLSMIIKNQKEKVKQFFKEEDILGWFVQMVFGLQYIHKKNILHRDLKTQNIFVTSQNLIKIGDFGISKSLSHTLDLATTAIGTPHYLSPEICRRKPYNHKSDMWSLGCVLYEMCALELAFPADNFVSLVHAICKVWSSFGFKRVWKIKYQFQSIFSGPVPPHRRPLLAEGRGPGPGSAPPRPRPETLGRDADHRQQARGRGQAVPWLRQVRY